MRFGLASSDLNYIIHILSMFPEIEKALIFGSRVKGTYKPGSDIDLALVGANISFDTLSKLHSILEEQSPLPYFFDLVDYTHLDHIELKDHISRLGEVIFERGVVQSTN